MVWAVLLVLVPAWRSSPAGADGGLRPAVALAVDLVAARVCHRRPDRTLQLHGQPLPVCGRCTALYLGGAAGLLLALVAAVRPSRRARGPAATTRLSPAWWPAGLDPRAAWLALAAIPTGLTWGLEFAGVWDPGTLVRTAVALPLGATAGWLIARALFDDTRRC